MALDMTGALDDETLLERFGTGDRSAAAVLTSRLAPMIRATAIRQLGNASEADDIVQEVMLKLWKIAPVWRKGDAKITTWLYRVAVNMCTDRLRRKRTVNIDAIAEPEDGQPAVAEKLMQKSRQSALYQALETLPDRQREAVILRHIETLTNPQIADIMELSVEAVESLTSRGKRALAAALSPQKERLGFTQ
jgi:RNA polymerase sigma factor (sigma-70 family)